MKRYLKKFIKEEILSKDKIENLQPNDIVTVYHGTSATNLPMVLGIDATVQKTRSYGGPKHEGIFVSPNPELAQAFSDYGELVIEIEVPAKFLYGTDYSGNTAKKQVEKGMPDPEKIWKNKYPNSFRPYLSQTMLQSSEPQALLVGMIRPNNIKRVLWKNNWYSIQDFLKSEPEYYRPYETKKTKLRIPSFDPTDGDISLEHLYNIINKEHNIAPERAHKNFLRMIETNRELDLMNTLRSMGWVNSAAKKIIDRIKRENME